MFLRCSRVAGVRASTRRQSKLVGPARWAPLSSQQPQPRRQPSTHPSPAAVRLWRPGLCGLGSTAFSLCLQ